MTVLTASQNMTTKSNLTVECHNTLKSFAQVRAIVWLWIPRDNFITGYEKPDDIAKLGKEHQLMGPERVVGISSAQIKKFFRPWKEINNNIAWMGAKIEGLIGET